MLDNLLQDLLYHFMLFCLLIQLDHKLFVQYCIIFATSKESFIIYGMGGHKKLNATLRGGQTFWTCLEGELGFLTHCERGKKVQT